MVMVLMMMNDGNGMVVTGGAGLIVLRCDVYENNHCGADGVGGVGDDVEVDDDGEGDGAYWVSGLLVFYDLLHPHVEEAQWCTTVHETLSALLGTLEQILINNNLQTPSIRDDDGVN